MSAFPCPWILTAAFTLDLIVGDPKNLPHPVRLMGRWINFSEKWFRKTPFSDKKAGSLMTLLLVPGTWLVCTAAVMAAHSVHPVCAFALHAVLIFYALSVKSLRKEALAVYAALREDNLPSARKRLSMIVGRDVTPLDQAGVVRAAVETVAENLVDGVIAPLFYAVLGGGPMAMAYKMVNTLDSMIGYKNKCYREFGWFAARTDDAVNFLPARISAVVISLAVLIMRRPVFRTIKTLLRDGSKHLSPNAGIPEAAFAGAIGIRLGGPNFYDGRLVKKPYIGEAVRLIESRDIRMAVTLMTVSAFICFIWCWGAAWVLALWCLYGPISGI